MHELYVCLTFFMCFNRLQVILDMRPLTIFPFYLEAIQMHGIPDCLICDKGTENRLMAYAQWLARAEGITEVICRLFSRHFIP